MLKYLSSEFLNDFTKFFKKSKNKKLRKNNHQYNVVIEHFSIFFYLDLIEINIEI